MDAVSHRATSSPTSAAQLRSEWSAPGIARTLTAPPASGTPNGSRAPLTTSTGMPAAASSAALLRSGCRGGRSGKASATTPAAPVAAAVRQATRPPLLRPPVTTAKPGQESRSAPTTVTHASSR